MNVVRDMNLWQIVGMGLCFAWVFIVRPAVDSSTGIQLGFQYHESLIIRFATVGFVFYVLIPLISKYLFI